MHLVDDKSSSAPTRDFFVFLEQGAFIVLVFDTVWQRAVNDLTLSSKKALPYKPAR